ncbi:MAG: hypothetical protein ISQ76_05920, partial [Opitutales bacterium]|nr:hypothetical protein [Opitutales bacterium]
MKNLNPLSSLGLYTLFIICFFIVSCGGENEGEETAEQTSDQTEQPTTSESNNLNTQANEVAPADDTELPPAVVEVKKQPNPNGVYLPTGEEKNNQPVYANQEGFSMWFDGTIWKITDETGGGKLISMGSGTINDNWKNGAKARYYPDEEYAKDATFRLAVAFQGSNDNKNAVRLFEQFVMQFPDDKLVAEVYLSLGDLAISEVKPDEQPNYMQIVAARKNYRMVRAKTEDIELASDSTFNEGGLLERIAENPEGLVNHYYTFDENEDEAIQENEFKKAELNASKDFTEYDLNGDKQLDFGELYDLATFESFKEIETLYTTYIQKFKDREGARISQATEKIGFACEKQGRPSEMLKMYFENIQKFGNDPSSVGVDEILKKYTKKYLEYQKLYASTLALLNQLQSPDEEVFFTYLNRKGIEEEHEGTVEEIVKDRRKLLPFLNAKFEGMDSEIYSEVARLKGAVFVNADYRNKFK